MLFWDGQTKRENLKFQMGITGVPFGRTEMLVPPPEPHERALARGKGPKGPGIRGLRKNTEMLNLFGIVLSFLEKNMKTNHEIDQRLR